MTLTLTLMLLSQVQIPLPPILFPAPPQLVVVEPGIQVVPDLDDEVFVVDNIYWTRRDGRWFKSPDHKGGWVLVDAPLVPPLLVKVPHGKYKRWKHEAKELKKELKEARKESKGHGKGKKDKD